jgi:hypothetical protein
MKLPSRATGRIFGADGVVIVRYTTDEHGDLLSLFTDTSGGEAHRPSIIRPDAHFELRYDGGSCYGDENHRLRFSSPDEFIDRIGDPSSVHAGPLSLHISRLCTRRSGSTWSVDWQERTVIGTWCTIEVGVAVADGLD